MIINKNPQPKSSFLAVEKDMAIIVNKMISNERLKRLLFYNSSDALDKPNISEDDSLALFGKNIKNVPKLTIDENLYNYIVINFNNFKTGKKNPEFRDNTISFDIICHYSTWPLKDFSLRPYKIAAELDSMFDKSRLTGIGLLEFAGMNELPVNDEFGGFCLTYRAYHGEEDKKKMPNPADEERFLEDFQEMINAQ